MTLNWQRLGIAGVLACTAGYLAHHGGYEDLVKSIVVGLIAFAASAQDSFVTHQRSTDKDPPHDPTP